MSENKDIKSRATLTENTLFAKEKRGFPFKKLFFALLIILFIALVLLFVVNMVINSYFGKIAVFDGNWQTDLDFMAQSPMYQDNVEFFAQNERLHSAYDKVLLSYAQATSDMKYDETVYNYAIFGTDQFADSEEKASADIVMLVSVNEEKEQVTYLSFETKMLMYIPSAGVGPMSDAYRLGGPQLLANTIELNYGIELDGFVELDMSAFANLIDMFGEIEVNGNADTVKSINEDILAFNAVKKLEGKDAVKAVKLDNGVIKLNGLQTLAYIRGAGKDKANIANTVLSQITRKIFDAGLSGVKTTLDVALEKMLVSMSRDDAGALITIGFSVFETIDSTPVGNMEGREEIVGVGYICDYQAERAAVVKALYN